MNNQSIAIIGGGIVGGSIAYHIGKETDGKVMVFERGEIAGETTARSGSTFGWYGDNPQRQLKRYAWELYNDFLANPRGNPKYGYHGRLTLATTDEEADNFKRYIDADDVDVPKIQQGGEDDPIEFLDPEEVKRRLFVPGLDVGEIAGSLYRPHFGYMDPVALTHEFVRRAKDEGVIFETNTTVTNIDVRDGRVVGIETDENSYSVDNVICAAGPWNVSIADSVGIDLPVKHTLGPMVRYAPTEQIEYDLPFIKHKESGFFCRQDFDGSILIGHRPPESKAQPDVFDPSNVSDEVSPTVKEEASDLLDRFFPSFPETEVVEEWVGVRSSTPDDRPILGWTDIHGFSIAAFDSSGIMLAPGAGRMIASQVVHEEPTEFYDAFSITRFDGYDDCRS